MLLQNFSGNIWKKHLGGGTCTGLREGEGDLYLSILRGGGCGGGCNLYVFILGWGREAGLHLSMLVGILSILRGGGSGATCTCYIIMGEEGWVVLVYVSGDLVSIMYPVVKTLLYIHVMGYLEVLERKKHSKFTFMFLHIYVFCPFYINIFEIHQYLSLQIKYTNF